MANTTLLRGFCPTPFFDASKFSQGGFIDGRFCAPVSIQPGLICCIPCPSTDFLYPPRTLSPTDHGIRFTDYVPGFNEWYRVAEGLSVVGLVCLVFLLVSFWVLSAEQTRRHYLSYCLIIAAILMAVSQTQSSDARLLILSTAWVCDTFGNKAGTML